MMIRKTTSGRATIDDIPDPIEPEGGGEWRMEGSVVLPGRDGLGMPSGHFKIVWFWVKEDDRG